MFSLCHTFGVGTAPTTLAVRQFTNSHRHKLVCGIPSLPLFSKCPPVQTVTHFNARLATKASLSSLSLSHGKQKQAVIVLSDMRDLLFLGYALQNLGYTIFSTGGTADALEEAGITVTKVKEISHFVAMLDRNHRGHMEALRSHDGGILEIVAVNLDYSDDGSPNVDLVDFDAEALLKAAALNSKDVLAVVSPCDYPAVIQFLKRQQDDQKFLEELGSKAMEHIYDNRAWLHIRTGEW
ncbi:bifunctional purine biosynthesis protein PurH-like [Zingiber officinale]|uniref:bifunctional purine biosynthesis protein PurH-like n=1 Tax=Zingiber officinale TaxID=94328 RepID=UPI001C4D06E9|nr:bifunctional purine biosynthesis protein PurH-like [Zingiber officinale]